MSSPRAAMSVATRTATRPGLEVGQGADALRLGLVAVDGGRRDPVAGELLGEPVRAVLGAGEDERLVDAAAAHERAQELALALAVHRVHELAHEDRGGVAGSDVHLGRPVEEAVGELADRVREGGREEERLAALRQQGEDPADVVDEAHVEHPVRLVEDEDLDLREVDRVLAGVVEEAAGRRDDDLGAGAQGARLGAEADAAVDRPPSGWAGGRRRPGRSPPPGGRARGSGPARGRARGGAARRGDRRGGPPRR